VPEITLDFVRTVRLYTVTGADPVTVVTYSTRTIIPNSMEITLRDGVVAYVDVFGTQIRRDGTTGQRTRVGWSLTYDPLTNLPGWVVDVITREGLACPEVDHA
jgi:hypothetical protein